MKYNIILTGSNSEIELCERLAIGNNAINLSGKFSLEELIALISISDLFVANSTGPLHIAAALGKPVVGFYPPVPALSATRWGPYTNKKALFIPDDMPCKDKCTKDECIKLNCMNSIETQNVLESITEIMKKREGKFNFFPHTMSDFTIKGYQVLFNILYRTWHRDTNNGTCG